MNTSWTRCLRIAAPIVALVLLAPALRAIEYSVPIYVSDENDLDLLYENEQITEAERDTLLDLMWNRIDLNQASRDELYQLPGLTYKLVDRLLAWRRETGDLERAADIRKIKGIGNKAWKQIRPFVEVDEPSRFVRSLSGRVRQRFNWMQQTRTESGFEVTDTLPPAFANEGDVKFLDRYRVGWALRLQERMPTPSFQWRATPLFLNTQGVVSKSESGPPGYFVAGPDAFGVGLTDLKFFASAQLRSVELIVGHFDMGFGQKLVFDTTGRTNPFGWLPDNQIDPQYNEVGFRLARGLRGLAINAEGLRVAKGLRFDGTAFVSLVERDVYQYDFGSILTSDGQSVFTDVTSFDVVSDVAGYEGCEQASNGTARDCCRKAYKYTNMTIPEVYRELTGGGSARLTFGGRHHLGVSGYGGKLLWRYDEFILKDGAPFSEYDYGQYWLEANPEGAVVAVSTIPAYDDTFAAFGADFATGHGLWSLFGEVAFTQTMAHAVYLRSLFELDLLDLTLEARQYATDYANPFSKGRANSDEHLGNRDRDERGARLLAVARLPWDLKLTSDTEVWQRMSVDLWNMGTKLRVDYDPLRWLDLGAFVQLKDKDMTTGGRVEAYSANRTQTIDGVSYDLPDRGMQLDWQVQGSVLPWKALRLSAAYKRRLTDVASSGDDGELVEAPFEPTHYFWGLISYKVMPELRLSTYFKYYDEDSADETRGEQFWRLYLEAVAKPWKSVELKVRYTLQRGWVWTEGSYKDAGCESTDERYAYWFHPTLHHVYGSVAWKF